MTTRAKLIVIFTIVVLFLGISKTGYCDNVVLPEDQSLFFQAEIFVAGLSDMPGYSNVAGSIGYAGRMGWRQRGWRQRGWNKRHNSFGLFAQFEHDAWLSKEIDLKLTSGVMNFGIGAEYLFNNDRIRSSFAFGTSTLMFDTAFNKMGTTGLFFDIRPAGLRWAISSWLILELTPITFTVAMPTIYSDTIIKHLEYKTVLTFEVSIP